MVLPCCCSCWCFPANGLLQFSFGAFIDDADQLRLFVASILGLLGYATGFYRDFDRQMLLLWGLATPVVQFATAMACAACCCSGCFPPAEPGAGCWLSASAGRAPPGEQISRAANLRQHQTGFIDDRCGEAAGQQPGGTGGGRFDQRCRIRQNQRYLAFRAADGVAALLKLLDDPAMHHGVDLFCCPICFIFDLIQARVDPGQLTDVPVVAVCETPFYGVNLLLQRLSGYRALSGLILAFIAPIMLGWRWR